MYVLVTGLPGSGKTTLAAPLAAALGWPLFAKDAIKETLWDALGGAGDRAWSARLGGASMSILWKVASATPNAVIDAFVHRAYRSDIALRGPVIEVHCACPADIALDRFRTRTRHACHFDTALLADTWEQWIIEDEEPLGLAALLTVDTTRPVDIDAVAARLRERV